ncbi:MAG TPA: hypothetical protein VF008_19125 [Niastella sp.]
MNEVKLENITDTTQEKSSPPSLQQAKTAPNDMTFNNWLTQICTTEKPEASIIAYNFGLLETGNGYTVYLIGSKLYDKEDTDWATEEDFVPALRYYALSPSDFKQLQFDVVQNKVKKMIKDFMKTDTYKKSFFAKAKAITIGFDDGDLEKIK